MNTRICVVTGTRAEYGLLRPLIKRIEDSEDTELLLLVTGMHLSPEFGYTYKEIEGDGIHIWKKVEMLMSSDSPCGIVKSMGIELLGIAECFQDEKIDMVVLLGDRYETMVVAIAAMIYGIPISHIHGGEKTEGAIDEAIRHSITKMSYLHFATIDQYRDRIVQLGEQPDRVFTVGSLGNESIHKLKLLSKQELEKSINFKIDDNTVLVTFHPVTLELMSAENQFGNILSFLDNHSELKVIFTKSNADTYGRVINQMIDEYANKNQDRCAVYSSLGQLRYLSVLQYIKFVLGNSSSGILEVPSFHIATIDIGDRQKGRFAPPSVVHCDTDVDSIENAYKKINEKNFENQLPYIINPYDIGETSKLIFDKIMEFLTNKKINLKKEFYDIRN